MKNTCLIQRDVWFRYIRFFEKPRFLHVFSFCLLPNLNVGFVSVILGILIFSHAYAAINNCAYEYGGYCYACNSPYVVATSTSIWPGNSGQGTQCVLFCGAEGNYQSPRDTFCNSSYTDSFGIRKYTYTVKSGTGVSGATCYMTNSISGGTTNTATYCSNLSYSVCAPNFYGNGSSCAACPASMKSGLYTNSALTASVTGKSAANTTSISGCYIPAGTYYDSTGTISITSVCYHD